MRRINFSSNVSLPHLSYLIGSRQISARVYSENQGGVKRGKIRQES